MPSLEIVRRFVPIAVLVCLLAGCASVTPIGDLLSNSSKYNGKTVRVKGDVTKSAGLVVAGAYQLKDGTGTLTVVTEGSSPLLRAQRWASREYSRRSSPSAPRAWLCSRSRVGSDTRSALAGLTVAAACPEWVQQAVDWNARYRDR